MGDAAFVAREPWADPGDRTRRVFFIARLMAGQQWERGVTDKELAEDWALPVKGIHAYSTEAARHLKLLGEREALLELVRIGAASRLDGAEDPAFVTLSRLLVDTVGGFTQRHEMKVELSGKSEAELFRMMLAEIKADPELCAQAIAFLTGSAPLLTEGEDVE
jgi:hypothetical protein